LKDKWKEFLKISICPYCKQPLDIDIEELHCLKCGRKFPIKYNIPYFIPGSVEFKYPNLREADRYT